MRLKEPLQGIKMAQGHILIHWCFFIVMSVWVEDDERPKDHHPEVHASSGADDEHGDHAMEAYEYKYMTIQILKYGHLVCGVI